MSGPTTPNDERGYAITSFGLGSSHFARRYSGNQNFFFSSRYWDGSLPSVSLLPYDRISISRWMGCPIRESPGQRLFAPHRGLSQLATPFIASFRQGSVVRPWLLGCKISLIVKEHVFFVWLKKVYPFFFALSRPSLFAYVFATECYFTDIQIPVKYFLQQGGFPSNNVNAPFFFLHIDEYGHKDC